MQNFSKYFKLDTVQSNQKLSPILVITDSTGNILFSLSDTQEELFLNNGDKVNVINCVSKVSNVKISNDFDTKKLKINRLRCTLYNYYDVNTKLSEYINTGIINKNLYLFYKSPTTYTINFNDNVGDYDCALVYTGEISRLNYDDKNISFTVEDKTQLKMGDKKVPHTRADSLPITTQEKFLSRYKKNNQVIPMTFGKVDKAPVLPHVLENNDKFIKILLDVQPTAGTFKTSKIPSMLDTTPIGSNNYFLYVKQGEDYIICEHTANTTNNQYKKYSNFVLQSFSGVSANYLIPEFAQTSGDYELFNNWEMIGYHQRQVVTAYAGTHINNYSSDDQNIEGSIFDVMYSEAQNLNESDHENLHSLNDNGGFSKKWFRQDDTEIQSSNVNFKIPSKRIEGSEGGGRWVILRIDEAVGDELINVSAGGNFIGNTFLAADWECYQDEDKETIHNNNIANLGGDRTGFFVSPINFEHWKKIQGSYPNLFWNHTTPEFPNSVLSFLLCETEEQISIMESEEGFPYELSQGLGIIDPNNPYRKCPIYVKTNEPRRSNKKYWGFRGANNNIEQGDDNWLRINGLSYGYSGNPQNVKIPQQDFNTIGVFEFMSDVGDSDVHSLGSHTADIQQGLEMNNIGLIQSVSISDLTKKEIYASVVGRKNHLFTEELDADNYNIGGFDVAIDIPLSNYIVGNPNEINLSYEELLQTFSNVITQSGNALAPLTYDDGGLINYTYDYMSSIFNPDLYSSLLTFAYQSQMQGQHTSAFWNTFMLLKDYIWRAYMLPVEMLHLEHALTDSIIGSYFITPTTSEWSSGTYYNYSLEGLSSSNYSSPEGFNVSSYNYLSLFNQNWSKTFGKAVYQYLFQDGNFGNWEDSWTFNYQTATWNNFEIYGGYHSVQDANLLGDEVPFDGFTLSANANYIDVDLTESINSKRQYSWDSFNINSIDDLISNFYVYMDDLSQAIGNSLIENMPTVSNVDNSGISNAGGGAWFGWNSISWNGTTSQLFDDITDFSNLRGQHFLGLGSEEGISININMLQEELYSIALSYYVNNQSGSYTTDGVIYKPSDIVMNILTSEMQYGKLTDDIVGKPDYNFYDLESINESRQIHNNWQMGFSINRQTLGKKLIEDILRESKSYPRFLNNGKFGLINVKERYSYEDIDAIINVQDIINYKFTQTKREDIITSINGYYRYDNGTKKYLKEKYKSIETVLPDFALNGYDMYEIMPEDAHKDISYKYHTHSETMEDFLNYSLLNNCNPHNEIEFTLPLNSIELSVGDVLHIPLINNEKAFNIDYSKVEFLNGQPIYPLWIVMSTDISMQGIKLKAVQLHYLGTTNGICDGNHGFMMPEDNGYDILGNMQEYNTENTFNNGNPIPNWNYNRLATIDNGVQIPFYDVNGDGTINVVDIIAVVNYILGTENLTNSQKQRLTKYNSTIDIITLVEMVNIVLGD